VTASHRSQGLGAELLARAEKIARDLDCRGLRLCTGVENERGKAFYEREGWTARALAFKKPLVT
jgi:GNAT superfamily N-acetyltransferase